MISIIAATCNRPAMFRDMLQSLGDTQKEFFYGEVVAVIDGNEESKWIAEEYHCKIDYSPTRRGALWAWNRALQLSSGDILVPAGDDQVFHPGWLDYALESHKEKLGNYGVVGMNDLAYDGNTQVATMFLFDRQYCKDHMGGIFAPPMYHYFCIDVEWNEKAKMLGRYHWDDRAVVEHLHSAHGKRAKDTTDSFKDDSWVEIDNKTFQERKAQGFPVTWQPII